MIEGDGVTTSECSVGSGVSAKGLAVGTGVVITGDVKVSGAGNDGSVNDTGATVVGDGVSIFGASVEGACWGSNVLNTG